MEKTKATVVFNLGLREIITASISYLVSYNYIELSSSYIEELNEGVVSVILEWNHGNSFLRTLKKEVKSIPEYYKFIIDVIKQQDEDIHNDYFHGEESSIAMDSILSSANGFEEGTGNSESGSSI